METSSRATAWRSQNRLLRQAIAMTGQLFFKFSPILKFKIQEESMSPALKPGDFVLAERLTYLLRPPKVNEIVVFQKEDKYLIKRIQKVKGYQYFVVGDNKSKSTDSRNFGWVKRMSIIGRVFYVQTRH